MDMTHPEILKAERFGSRPFYIKSLNTGCKWDFNAEAEENELFRRCKSGDRDLETCENCN